MQRRSEVATEKKRRTYVTRDSDSFRGSALDAGQVGVDTLDRLVRLVDLDRDDLPGRPGQHPREAPRPRTHLEGEVVEVTQHDGTERPFSNEYWNNKRPGIYVDVVSGEQIDHVLTRLEDNAIVMELVEGPTLLSKRVR